MGLFSIQLNSLEDLLLLQLEDLYDAERRLTEALPKMADAAHSPELQQAFRMHLQETEGHVRRLDQVFRDLDREPHRETCDAMKGLISEGSTMVSAEGDPAVKDAALIAAAQRVEHYEIAAYGTVRTLARHLGREEIADLLQQTLDEEGNADKILTEIAESSVNAQAGRNG
ncbi:MAG TPA: ferritin-like domain-containing protein [Planctomycetaceae bacterium]|nr:ferritin-like domain-containing protein [Planctomycetaceae bacterium]